MAEGPEPTEIALIQSKDQTLLVARSSGGGHFGVVCPSDLVPTLQSFVSTSNPSLIRFWKAYARSKGADTFFWDLIGIAEAIRDLSSVPRSRRLLHFTSESDLFHNSWQARLMRLCVVRGREVEIIPASSERRQPDFRIRPDVAVEVKTLFSESGVEIDDEEGMRLAPPDADKLARNIAMKVQDALEQVGQGGVVVVALWCDLAANAICRLGDTLPLDTIDLTPGTFVLALGPSEGVEPYAAVTLPIQDVEQFADRLSARLRTHTKPVFVPFTSRHMCVASGDDWISIGRRVQIGTWCTQYAPYEAPGNERGPRLIPPEVLKLLPQPLKIANTQMAAWNEAIQREPLESRLYSSAEMANDPRFVALFAWDAQLFMVLRLLRQSSLLSSELLPEGRPRADANRFFKATFREDGRLDQEGFLKLEKGVQCMARLTNHLMALCHSTQHL